MLDAVPVEFDKADVEIIEYITENKLTKTSTERIVATINACKHAVRAEVAGDFVECGVWRGGNAIAAKRRSSGSAPTRPSICSTPLPA